MAGTTTSITTEFKEMDANAIEEFRDEWRDLVYSSIVCAEVDKFDMQLSELNNALEKINNILGVESNPSNKICKMYGEIKALTDLEYALSSGIKDRKDFSDLVARYPKFQKLLEVIFECDTISTSDLCKKLDISNSGLRRMLKNDKTHNLIIVQRIGNSNYFSLSVKGKSLFKNGSILSNKMRNNYFDAVLSLLDGMSKQIQEISPSSEKVIIKYIGSVFSPEQKKLIKSKIDNVFNNRNYGLLLRMKKDSIQATIAETHAIGYNEIYNLPLELIYNEE